MLLVCPSPILYFYVWKYLLNTTQLLVQCTRFYQRQMDRLLGNPGESARFSFSTIIDTFFGGAKWLKFCRKHPLGIHLSVGSHSRRDGQQWWHRNLKDPSKRGAGEENCWKMISSKTQRTRNVYSILDERMKQKKMAIHSTKNLP